VKRRFLLDTGPLVALLNRSDRYHAWAAEQWTEADAPLLSCEAVVAEACHLLRSCPGGGAAVVELVRRGAIALPFALAEESAAVARLLDRYADLPMSLADACLVRMAETLGCSVMTIDADFRVYRIHGRRVIPTRMPE